MATEVERVICFGDSIMHGVGLGRGEKSYVDLLKDHYLFDLNGDLTGPERSQRAVFYSSAVWNDSAPRLMSRVAIEAAARLRVKSDSEPVPERSKNLFVVGLGTNDSWLHPDTQKPITPMREFTHCMKEIATCLSALGRVLYIGSPATDEATVNKVRTKDVAFLNDSAVEYETAAINIFRSVGARCIAFARHSLYDPDFWPLSEDGVHPSAKGHAWLYYHIKPHFDVSVR